jgi:predicted amidohydrolase
MWFCLISRAFHCSAGWLQPFIWSWGNWELARHTDPIHKRFKELAISYNINIITSMPFLENGTLYNVGFLCKRDGTSEMYAKIHVTQTKCNIGNDRWIKLKHLIPIVENRNYDLLWRRISRTISIISRWRHEYIICTFPNRYQKNTRVKHCAQARAIENECYVAIAGCGNLPR